MNQVEQRAESHMSWLRATLGLGIGLASSGAAFIIDHSSQHNGAIVEAAPEFSPLAAPCRVRLLEEVFRFVDNPVVPNRKGLIDPVDFSLGGTDPGEVVLNYRTDPKNPNSPRKEIGRKAVNSMSDHSEVIFDNIVEEPNTNNGTAIEVLVSLSKDKVKAKDNPQLPVEEPVTIRCGTGRYHVSGRYATEDEINTVLNTTSFTLNKVDVVANQVAQQRGFPFNPPSANNPAENLKALKDRGDDVKRHMMEVRAKEGVSPKPATPAQEAPPGGKGEYIPPANQPDNNYQTEGKNILVSAGDFANQNGGMLSLGALGIFGLYRGYRKLRGI